MPAGGPVNALPHHQTLERAIDWSYDMLAAQVGSNIADLSLVDAARDDWGEEPFE